MNNQHKGRRHWWEYLFLIIPLMIFVLLIYYNPDLKRQAMDNLPADNPVPTQDNSSSSLDNDLQSSSSQSSIVVSSSSISSSSKSSNSSQAIAASRPIKKPISKEVSIGDTQSKKIALTFDGGASAVQAPNILRILKDNGVHSTFFTTGKWAENNPETIKQIVSEGHTLGNHTYDHQELTKLTDAAIIEEFAMAEKIIKSIVPATTTKPYFRPPYGDRNSHVLEVAGNAGYQSIYWTIDALDWQETATAESVKQKIYNNVKNGAIILMHVGDDITPAVLDEVIKKLKSDGYQPVTIDELLG